MKTSWQNLFSKALELLKAEAIPVQFWSFGGGTALHVVWNCPRCSKDIDIFLTDAQLLVRLSPRVNSLAEEMCAGDYVEQANFIKLFLKEGEIDFIVAPRLTSNPVFKKKIPPFGVFYVDAPWEIVVKKFFYKASSFTVRDVVDFVSVLSLYERYIPADFWNLLQSKVVLIRDRWEHLKPILDKGLSKLVFQQGKLAVPEIKDSGYLVQVFESYLVKLENRLGENFSP